MFVNNIEIVKTWTKIKSPAKNKYTLEFAYM